MARGYSEKFIRELFADESESVPTGNDAECSSESSTEGDSRPTVALRSSYSDDTAGGDTAGDIPADGGGTEVQGDEGEGVSDTCNLGRELAKACVKAKLPMSYVATPLQVSKLTVFNWFHGKPVRKRNKALVKAFTQIVNDDLREGILPVSNNTEAKEYIDKLTSSE